MIDHTGTLVFIIECIHSRSFRFDILQCIS